MKKPVTKKRKPAIPAKKKNFVSVTKGGKKLFGAAAAAVLRSRASKSKKKPAAKKTSSKRRNPKEWGPDHPIEVTKYFRGGGPNYATARKRAIEAGQRDLFAPEASMEQLLSYLRKKNPTVLDAVKRRLGVEGFKKASPSVLKKTMKDVVLEQLQRRATGTKPKARKTAKLTAKRRRNPSSDQERIMEMHEGFFGRPVSGFTLMEAPDYYPDDLMVIGEMTEAGYIARKDHIGDGKTYNYVHEFGEKGGNRPVLTVDANGNLLPVGGDYKIKPEGIDD